MLARALLIGSMLWPAGMGLALAARITGRAPLASGVVYVVGSVICHQRSERSFHTDGHQWPVCARCAALYLSAPFGALLAWRRRLNAASAATMLAVTAIPTVVTLAVEWLGLSALSNVLRAVSALPAGAAIAFVLVREAGTRPVRG